MQEIIRLTTFLLFFLPVLNHNLLSQDYSPLVGNEELKKEYIANIEEIEKNIIKQYTGDYKSEFKEYYQDRAENMVYLAENENFIFDELIFGYLNRLKNKIDKANPSVDLSSVQIVISRNSWPNAFSVGDGTIAFHVAIFPFFDNEDQFVYIMCHEIAHYLLNHSDNKLKNSLDLENSKAYKKEVKKIKKSTFNQYTQAKELLTNNLYSQRSHSRENEIEADTYGLELYLNTSYNPNESMGALEKLGEMNHP